MCEALNVTNKHSPVSFDYTFGSSPVAWLQKVKYLGVIISSNLKWNDHCKQIVHKATQSLNRCTDRAKAAAYLTLVKPCLEYCKDVWTLYTTKNINMIESVQRRAAKWIKSSFNPSTFQWSKSSDECLKELGWPSLKKRHDYACIAMLYSIMH